MPQIIKRFGSQAAYCARKFAMKCLDFDEAANFLHFIVEISSQKNPHNFNEEAELET